MAKAKKPVKAPVKKRSKGKKPMNIQIVFLMFMFFVASLLFLPTTFILFFGMMPTWALFATDRTKGRLKTLSVGLINFAGCAYVLMQLWTKEHTIDYALKLMLSPDSIIIMFLAAMAGYVIYATLRGLVSSIILQQTQSRLEKIIKDQDELEKRWGFEVTGKVALDIYGFPVEISEDDNKDS